MTNCVKCYKGREGYGQLKLVWVVRHGLNQVRKWHLSWELEDRSLAKWNWVKEPGSGNSICRGLEVWKRSVGLRNSQRLVCDWNTANNGGIDMVSSRSSFKGHLRFRVGYLGFKQSRICFKRFFQDNYVPITAPRNIHILLNTENIHMT